MMANLSEDIQSVGSDTGPPKLDRYDFEFWQQCIRLYCLGKENGENILLSIDEGPFKMEKFRETLADGALGPERDRVVKDLTPEEKERYKTDICTMNILLQGLPKDIYTLINHYTDTKEIWDNIKMLLEGSELTRDERESQLYNEFEQFHLNKGETIHEYYVRFVPIVKLNRGLKTSNYDQLYAYLKQHEAHANENKMMLERYPQHTIDPLAFVSNVLLPQYPTQSSAILQSAYVPPVTYPPHFPNNTHLDSGLTSTDDLIENLTKTVTLLAQSYMTHLPQTNNQLRTSSNTRNQATVQNGRVVVQNVQEYFKDKMQENRVVLDEEQLLFIAGGQDSTFDDDVDEPPTMFMANLSSTNLIYDEAGLSYDSDILSEYVKDNAVQVVQSNVSSMPNDALMMIINGIHEQAAQCISTNEQNKVVNESLTAELARYKEQVEIYEKRARFKLTEREQKIDEQLRIIITDRNNKEESLKKELHFVKMQLNSTIDHNKLMVDEVATLKKDFKQKENKYLEDFLDMKALKEKVEDKLFKQDQSLQIVHMLCKPKPFYDEKKKVAIGYKNPLYLTSAMQVQSTLYNGHEIVKTNHALAVVHDSEDTLELAKITRKKMLEKMQSPLCVEKKVKIAPLDYSKENYLGTFKPQRQFSVEQIFWSFVLKPILEMTLYPPNTPAKACP
ncbi:hypothetical protein Tco_0300782 [Tanacetum coccineum]